MDRVIVLPEGVPMCVGMGINTIYTPRPDRLAEGRFFSTKAAWPG